MRIFVLPFINFLNDCLHFLLGVNRAKPPSFKLELGDGVVLGVDHL